VSTTGDIKRDGRVLVAQHYQFKSLHVFTGRDRTMETAVIIVESAMAGGLAMAAAYMWFVDLIKRSI